MSGFKTGLTGIVRIDEKQTDLTVTQYDGIARPGELVVDLTTFNVYVGNTYGNLIPISAGGNVANANITNLFSNTANITNLFSNSAIINNFFANTANISNLFSNNINSNVITSNVANITSLTVTGNANLGNVGNIYIGGGSNGQVLTTDGAGNLSWTTISTSSISNGTSNVSIPIANGPVTISSGGVANVVTVYDSNVNLSKDLYVTSNIYACGFVSTTTVTSPTGPITIQASGTGNISLVTGTGNVNLSPNTFITNLKDPINNQDAATKYYVDQLAQGLRPKATAQHYSGTNLAGTYNNGASGIGATLTLSSPLTSLDGVSITVGNRILVNGQTAAEQNGIYEYTNSTTLTRTSDADTAAELPDGSFVYVENGTSYGKTGWALSSTVTTIGVDGINFLQISGAGTYIAGTALSLSGVTFSLTNTAVTPGTYGAGPSIASFTVDQQGRITAAGEVPIPASNLIIDGSSSVQVYPSGNVATTVAGNANVFVVSSNNAYLNSYPVGYRDLHQYTITSSTSISESHLGNHVYFAGPGNVTYTIGVSASIPIGGTITLITTNGNINIAPSGVSLYGVGNSTSGTKILGIYGMASLIKVSASEFIISGNPVL